VKRLLVALIAAAVLAFAIQGGEYGTTDLLRQRARKRAAEADIRSLQRDVDSLRLWKRALTSDPAVQERIAREEFGMVRGDKEILYRFSDSPSDSGSDSGRRRGFGRGATNANRRP
jgi:cell division protein FtsB